jgi:hypothetical protein
MSNTDTDSNAASQQGLKDLNTTQQSGVRYLGLIIQTLQKAFIQFGGKTTTATAGAASALPATPAGYVSVVLPDGTIGKIPFYNV